MSDDSTASTVLGGRYAIDRKLARGGMADIFLAQDLVLERPVVIKTLLPQYAGDPAFVERFRREATSAAKLNHPNVVLVYDWGSHDDSYFMAMEYVEGQSLGQILQRTGRLSPQRAIEITADAAAGLGFAHANGMVHRDVKPGNIMVTTAGEVKVADFGVARALDASDSLTQTGNVMGTAAYFSPEQARGEVVGPASDLYSLGVVLFEMVTGRRPFSGTSPVSVAYKHVGQAPPTASMFIGDLPPAVDVVIATLLAKSPDDRYRDADHLQADLDRIRAGVEPRGVEPATATREEPAAAAAAATRPLRSPLAAPPVDRPVRASSGPPPTDRSGARFDPVRRPSGPQPVSAGNRPLVAALVALVAVAAGLLLVVLLALPGGDGPGDDAPSGREASTTGSVGPPTLVERSVDPSPPTSSEPSAPTDDPGSPSSATNPATTGQTATTDESSTEPPPTTDGAADQPAGDGAG